MTEHNDDSAPASAVPTTRNAALHVLAEIRDAIRSGKSGFAEQRGGAFRHREWLPKELVEDARRLLIGEAHTEAPPTNQEAGLRVVDDAHAAITGGDRLPSWLLALPQLAAAKARLAQRYRLSGGTAANVDAEGLRESEHADPSLLEEDDLRERGLPVPRRGDGETIDLAAAQKVAEQDAADQEAAEKEAAEQEALARVNLRPFADILGPALDRMDARAEGRERPITTPWRGINEQLPGGGLWPGCHVLAGSTGIGKTAWLMQLALHAVQERRAAVVYGALELDDMSIALRLVAEVARPAVGWSRLVHGDATLEERARVRTAPTDALSSLYIDDGGLDGWTAERMRLVAKKTRALHPDPDVPVLIIVDFLQLIVPKPDERLDVRERVGKAAYMARAVAREYDATVLLVSSVSRANYGLEPLTNAGIDADKTSGGIVTERFMRNPEALIGLGKESGEIEYAADSVTTMVALPRDGSSSSRQVVFAAAKLRAGRPGWCALNFDGHRFTDDPAGGARVLEALADAPKPSDKSKRADGPTSKSSRGAPNGSAAKTRWEDES